VSALWDQKSAEAAKARERGIHAIPLPTPFGIGPVNTYLLDDDPLTLIDTGPNSGLALDALESELGKLNKRIEDLELIVVSHQHMDHLGLTEILARRSGAPVAALASLVPCLAQYDDWMEADDRFAAAVMLRHGIPEETCLALRSVSRSFRGWGAPTTVTQPLAEGDELSFRDRTLTVLHRPGHSPSDTIFFDADNRTLLAADHLIASVSSNPLIARPLEAPLEQAEDAAQLARPKSLMIYLDSLAKTRAMKPIDLILPGHGPGFTDHVELIDERFRLHERRANKLYDLIAERPRSGYELAQALWGNVAVTQAYLTLSEALGHVDVLISEGRVAEHFDDDGIAYFEAISSPAS
jgi:glyoxylase-like metal-dependent hydrolase (beta-lactamase superfamily II)